MNISKTFEQPVILKQFSSQSVTLSEHKYVCIKLLFENKSHSYKEFIYHMSNKDDS